MAWYELFSFQELSRVMKNLFFENILQAKGILFLNKKPFSLLSSSLNSDCLNDVLDYTVTECFSTFSSCVFFYIFLSSILWLRPVENTQYLETQRKFPEGEERSLLNFQRDTRSLDRQWMSHFLSVWSFSHPQTSSFESSNSGAPRGTLALCVCEALSKAHLWSSVPSFNWLWIPDNSLSGSEFQLPLLHTSSECVHLCLTHAKWQNGQQGHFSLPCPKRSTLGGSSNLGVRVKTRAINLAQASTQQGILCILVYYYYLVEKDELKGVHLLRNPLPWKTHILQNLDSIACLAHFQRQVRQISFFLLVTFVQL